MEIAPLNMNGKDVPRDMMKIFKGIRLAILLIVHVMIVGLVVKLIVLMVHHTVKSFSLNLNVIHGQVDGNIRGQTELNVPRQVVLMQQLEHVVIVQAIHVQNWMIVHVRAVEVRSKDIIPTPIYVTVLHVVLSQEIVVG